MGLSGLSGLSGVSGTCGGLPPVVTVRTYTIASSAADAYVSYYGFSYPPATPDVDGDGANNLIIAKGNFGSPIYANNSVLLQFSAAGDQIGAGETITAAKLQVWLTATPDVVDNPRLQGEYYNWGASADIGDWATATGTDAFSGVNFSAWTTGGYTDIPLTGFTGISKTGTTYFRIGIDLTMTAGLLANRVKFTPYNANPSRACKLIVTSTT